MNQSFPDARTFMAELADMAEELRHTLLAMADDAERYAHVVGLMSVSDMAFGLWPDSDSEGGTAVQVIKGEEMMPPLVGFETAHEISIAAIPCVGLEVALVAREEWRIPDCDDAPLRKTPR